MDGEEKEADPDDDTNANPLKMVKYVITRWSSAYMMMKRILKLRVPLVGILQQA